MIFSRHKACTEKQVMESKKLPDRLKIGISALIAIITLMGTALWQWSAVGPQAQAELASVGDSSAQAHTVLRLNRDVWINGRKGILRGGSLIAVPAEHNHYNHSGPEKSLNLVRTLENWALKPGHQHSRPQPVRSNLYPGHEEYLFPVRIIKAAPGSGPIRSKLIQLPLQKFARDGALEETGVTGLVLANLTSSDQQKSVRSNPPTSESTLEAQKPCTDCANKSALDSAPQALAQQVLSSLPEDDNRLKILPATPGAKPMSPLCRSFSDNQGGIGEWGQETIRIMSEDRYRNQFLKSNALGGFCPRFDSLSEKQKLQAWLWFWQVLANEESDCRSHVTHPTHYRDPKTGQMQRLNMYEGFGLFAFERDPAIRAWRGKDCHILSTVSGQLNCAIRIMDQVHFRSGHSAQRSSGSYWGPIHRSDRQIVPNMRRFAGCF